ncbi:MAG: hypothetical protein KDE47_15635, partial [Caldilineaceae bacterium]|nr:hypothetical protein [Caldilineaceae bacterium]
LTAVLGAEDPAAVEQMLFTRCLLSVQSAGAEVSVATLPDAVIEAIVQTMDEVDPQANVVLTLTCPTCTHQWQAILDILGYLWSELDAWARRILREVHCLAFAYGWRECEILEMSPWRRQIYLEMIGS